MSTHEFVAAAEIRRFGAWQLIAFVSTLQPSLEATIRNGISCAAGVCIGGVVGLLLVLAIDLLLVITPVAVELAAEAATMIVIAVFIGTITWIQPGPVSKYSLDGIADWKILLQVRMLYRRTVSLSIVLDCLMRVSRGALLLLYGYLSCGYCRFRSEYKVLKFPA